MLPLKLKIGVGFCCFFGIATPVMISVVLRRSGEPRDGRRFGVPRHLHQERQGGLPGIPLREHCSSHSGAAMCIFDIRTTQFS
jgi:hypothetical protein